MLDLLDIYSPEKRNTFLRFRAHEIKFGSQVQTLLEQDFEKGLDSFQKRGGRFVLLGVPEDIGVCANHGVPGAKDAWYVFLDGFLNRQENRFLQGEKVLLLGHLITQDLYQDSPQPPALDFETLGKLVEEIDRRLTQVLKIIFHKNLIPIVIGGGHNNAYGCLKSASEVFKTPIDCVNIDPHADFRMDLWRHSGNGFAFADREGFLGKYSLFGAHKNYNSESMLQHLERRPQTQVQFWENMEKISLGWEKTVEFLAGSPSVGLELDVDSIVGMPASAFTSVGFTYNDIFFTIKTFTQKLLPCYFHVAEAAPFLHKDGGRGADIVKKSLPEFVCTFIENR